MFAASKAADCRDISLSSDHKLLSKRQISSWCSQCGALPLVQIHCRFALSYLLCYEWHPVSVGFWLSGSVCTAQLVWVVANTIKWIRKQQLALSSPPERWQPTSLCHCHSYIRATERDASLTYKQFTSMLPLILQAKEPHKITFTQGNSSLKLCSLSDFT